MLISTLVCSENWTGSTPEWLMFQNAFWNHLKCFCIPLEKILQWQKQTALLVKNTHGNGGFRWGCTVVPTEFKLSHHSAVGNCVVPCGFVFYSRFCSKEIGICLELMSEFLRPQVASQKWVHINILWQVSISKAFIRAPAKPGKAAQLCVFILGTWYLYLRCTWARAWVWVCSILLVIKPTG